MASLKTHYAPPDRVDPESVIQSHNLVMEYGYIKDVFLAMPEVAAVLNEQRQIIYCNEALLSLMPGKDYDDLIGKRPGEAVSCIHSTENIAGCGTSEHCRYCGAVNSILKSQKNREKVSEECRIVSFIEEEEVSFDFRVTATPITIKGSEFTMLFMQDISGEKRRQALERIFFHDIINTAGGIQGFVGFLQEIEDPVVMKDYIKIVDQLSHDLVDEIESQRALTLAESGDLVVRNSEIDPLVIIGEVKNSVSYHKVAENKEIILEPESEKHIFSNDPVLLKRVLINMLKNAMEATEEGGRVTIGFSTPNDKIVFFVKNDAFMSKEVQMQVFRRSFSTKGKDRGLGTYSIKLLSEKYLKGKVWFESNEQNGTTFFSQMKSA